MSLKRGRDRVRDLAGHVSFGCRHQRRGRVDSRCICGSVEEIAELILCGSQNRRPAAPPAAGRTRGARSRLYYPPRLRTPGPSDALRAVPAATRFLSLEPLLGPLPSLDLTGIDWVIAGGESGPGHRPIDLDWIRDLRDRCAAQGIAFFFKQVGGATPKAGGRELDGRTWDQMPTLVG